MLPKGLSAMVMVSVVLAVVPLPMSEKGTVTVEAGESWVYPIDLEVAAHITCIIKSGGPVDVFVCGEEGLGQELNGSFDLATHSAIEVTQDHWTEELPAGHNYLVVVNPGHEPVEVKYQVHVDYVLLGNLTAKNILVMALALFMGLVALALYGRRGWP